MDASTKNDDGDGTRAAWHLEKEAGDRKLIEFINQKTESDPWKRLCFVTFCYAEIIRTITQ